VVEWTGAFAGIGVAALLLVPLALKWQLPIRIVGAWILVVGAVSGAAWVVILGVDGLTATWLVVQAITILVLSAAAAAAAFFRDPERDAPTDPAAVISPADGTVLYVRRFAAGEAPPIEKHGKPTDLEELAQVELEDAGHLIGIGMHLLNVHVNRAPLGGRVSALVHTPGQFISLRRDGATSVNERFTTVIEGERTRVLVVQIASRLVRRIVSYLAVGEDVAKGQRIGMIKFGSQVDVILPDSAAPDVRVKPGQIVRAGVTVLALVAEPSRPPTDGSP